MSFKEIFCQDRAIDILQRAFATDRWAHAYIFAGPEGVGKFKMAREWAKLLGCEEPVVENGLAESCGSCESCRLFEAGSSPDFNHIYKELLEFTEGGKDKKTPVDLPINVIREFLLAKVSAKPTVSQRKVFVVSEAERLNNSSQNCLLKVLEDIMQMKPETIGKTGFQTGSQALLNAAQREAEAAVKAYEKGKEE